MDTVVLELMLQQRGARLWWRDDDACADTPALRRLLDISALHQIPLLLAVIPELMDESLPTLVQRYPLVRVAQHGVAHKNAAPAGQKKQELVAGYPLDALLRGKERLRQAFPEQFRPLLVPPWNRIDAGLVMRLTALGYTGLSTYAGAARQEPLLTLDCQADPVAWGTGDAQRPNPFRGSWRTTLPLLRSLMKGEQSLGLLSHHLGMDEGSWAYCARLLRRLRPYFTDPDLLFGTSGRSQLPNASVVDTQQAV